MMREKKILDKLIDNNNFMVQFDEQNIFNINAIIFGPEKTPYHNGIFCFEIKCPDTYPQVPPFVNIKTTNEGKTRFNPNLYANGKVCLTMLGTFGETTWSAMLTIEKILHTISSIMTEDPYHNEPSYEKCTKSKKCILYAAKIRHETIRIAIIDACKNILNNSQQSLYFNHKIILKKYLNLIPSIKDECVQNRILYPDKTPFIIEQFEYEGNQCKGVFKYGELIDELHILENKIKHTLE